MTMTATEMAQSACPLPATAAFEGGDAKVVPEPPTAGGSGSTISESRVVVVEVVGDPETGGVLLVLLVVVDGLPEELLGTSEQVSKQPLVDGNDDEATLRTSVQHDNEASAVAQSSFMTVVSLGQAETPEHGPSRPLVSQAMYVSASAVEQPSDEKPS